MLKTKGFTLIELLIVIGIIGILSGVLFVVLDPAAQRTKANQSVVRANLEKICTAKIACLTTDTAGTETNCNTYAKIGATVPTQPTGATYPTDSTLGVTPEASIGTCVFQCSSTTGVISVKSGYTCNIQ